MIRGSLFGAEREIQRAVRGRYDWRTCIHRDYLLPSVFVGFVRVCLSISRTRKGGGEQPAPEQASNVRTADLKDQPQRQYPTNPSRCFAAANSLVIWSVYILFLREYNSPCLKTADIIILRIEIILRLVHKFLRNSMEWALLCKWPVCQFFWRTNYLIDLGI